jgi:hypothetical protein
VAAAILPPEQMPDFPVASDISAGLEARLHGRHDACHYHAGALSPFLKPKPFS